jgi:hypothetical protein
MPDFNPDQFLAETSPGGGFDPDKFLKETSPGPKAPAQRTDVGDALLRGTVSGASAGFGDELAGALEALGSKVGLRGLAGPVNEIHRASPDEDKQSFADAYRTGRDQTRQRYHEAAAEHPWAYKGAQLGGGLATALVPGVGLAGQGARAGLAGAVATGAGFGGLTGLGESEADMTKGMKGVGQAFDDTKHGAFVGALTGGALYGAGKVGSAIWDKVRPGKVASVMLNTPEEAIDNYIARGGEAINNAPTRSELAQELAGEHLPNLKNLVTGGSQESRQILANEGKTLGGDALANVYEQKASDMFQRAEGTMSESQQATYNWLKSEAEKLRGVGKPVNSPFEAAYSTNRAKDQIQNLDKITQFETGPGRFSDVDNIVKGDVRKSLDSMLKSESPAYAEQMKGVAKDTALLKELTETTGNGSIQGIDNILKRVQKDRNFDAGKALGDMDHRLGSDFLQRLKDAETKEALSKSYTNGSRAVNLYKEMGGKNPLARAAMGAVGATVDKYGAPIARGLVDKTAQIQQMLNSSEGFQRLGPYANLLKEAAQKGNQSLAAAHFVLSQSDPNYNKIFPTDSGQ